MSKILLFGAGGHAKSCIDVIEKSKKYTVLNLIDDKKTGNLYGYQIIIEKELFEIKKKCKQALITFGGIKNLKLRKIKFDELKKIGFLFPVIISPTSYISNNSQIDEGSILMHQTLLNTGSRIGKNCIINTKVLIEHDVKVEDNCHISTGSIINGNVLIKENTFLGSGCIVHNNISIGKNCIITAGSIIKKNIPDNSIIKKK